MQTKKYQKPVITKINAGVPSKFGNSAQLKTMNEIDGNSVSDLLSQFGSPLYVVSEQTMEKTYNDATRAFTSRYPDVQFAWSYKTNYLDAVCCKFHKLGSWAEVVSMFEYRKALQNGVPGDQIIFNGPEKTADDLKIAIENGSFIHVDHFDELFIILNLSKTVSKRPKLAIRVNMDTGIYPKWDRFGFNYENGDAWNAINRIMNAPNLDLVGLHCHIGTYMMSADPYVAAANVLADLAKKVYSTFNHNISYIDLGGGFASKNTLKGAYLPGTDTCPTFDEYASAIIKAITNAGFPGGKLPKLILESGRALIDDAGILAGSVIANKRMADGTNACVIDIGINLLFTSFWYDHTVLPTEYDDEPFEEQTIFGPMCMNIDIIRKNIKFPILDKGKHIVIPRIGAYNMTQWLQFITLRPNIIMIDSNGKANIIRNKETNEDFSRKEEIPAHLKLSQKD